MIKEEQLNETNEDFEDFSTSLFDNDEWLYFDDIEYYECDNEDIELLTPLDIKRSVLVDCSKQSILDIILLPIILNTQRWFNQFELNDIEFDRFEYEDTNFWSYLSGSIIKTPIGYGYRRSQYPE